MLTVPDHFGVTREIDMSDDPWTEKTGREMSDQDRTTIPIAGEELAASTREVETGRLVVRKRVETVPHDLTVDVAHDEVDIERVAMDQMVEQVPEARYEGDVLIVPVIEEVIVVEKRLKLVEEVRITTRRVTGEQVIHDEPRREVVEVVEEEGPSDR